MKKTLISAVAIISVLPMTVWAHGSCDEDLNHCAYWHDSAGSYVHDSSDRCVRTGTWFEEAQVEGCSAMMQSMAEPAPMDADGDGVMDSADSCPATVMGVAVDPRGCALDSDKDGVLDGQDSCPETAVGIAVDMTGCAADLDGDGVLNAADQCPDTAAGKPVNAEGCEPPAKVELSVDFAPNSSDLDSNYDPDQMQKLAAFLAANPDTQVEISGHTSRDVGQEGYNQKLSERRAAAVVDLLVDDYGANRGQLKSVGYGQDRPKADNDTTEGRRQNRRVEAAIID